MIIWRNTVSHWFIDKLISSVKAFFCCVYISDCFPGSKALYHVSSEKPKVGLPKCRNTKACFVSLFLSHYVENSGLNNTIISKPPDIKVVDIVRKIAQQWRTLTLEEKRVSLLFFPLLFPLTNIIKNGEMLAEMSFPSQNQKPFPRTIILLYSNECMWK